MRLSKELQDIRNFLANILYFLQHDIWRLRLRDLSRPKSFFIKQLRVILAAFKGFDEDRCKLRASALTFYTLMSIVPVVAMAFGISKAFGLESTFEGWIMDLLSGQEAVANRILEFSQALLENAKGGLIAGIGVVVLFYSAFKVLMHIERSFNEIWGIRAPRTLGRKIADYIAILFLCPILLVIASSATVFVTKQAQEVMEGIKWIVVFRGPLMIIIKILPFAATWILFTFIYALVPNTSVKLRSALLAGIAAGTVYELVHWGYVHSQIGVTRMGAIYGSFAALPLFLIWIQVSWLIVLFGAEVSFAHQNVETYELEPDCLQASHALRRLLALKITQALVRNFEEGRKAWTATEIAHAIEIPIRLSRDTVHELVKAGILSETHDEEDDEPAYQPARSVANLTVKSVIDSLEKRGINTIPMMESDQLHKLSDALKIFSDLMERSPSNLLLKDI